MLSLDIRTLALVLGLAYILEAIAIYFQYLIGRTYRGIGWWVLGFTSVAIGFILLLLRDVVSIELISIFFANTLLVLGPMLVYIGIRRFLDKKEHRGIVLSILTVFMVLFFYFTYVDNDIAIRTLIMAAVQAPIALLTAWSLWVNRTRSISGSVNFLSGIFLFQSCIFPFRVVEFFFSDPVSGIFIPTATQTLAFLVPLIVGLLLTFGLILMINQRLNAEIKEAKEHFELIFNTSPDASLIARFNDGIIVDINEEFSAATGFTRDETVGKPIMDIPIWKNPADQQRILDELGEKGFCENFEAVLQRKDLSQNIGIISVKTITLKGIPHIITTTRDITRRKQREEALRQSEARYRAVTQSASDAIITADSTGIIVSWNRGAEKIFSYTEAEISGQSLNRLIPERYRQQHLAGMKRVQAGGEPHLIGKTVELEGLRKDGSEFPIELSLAQWETTEGRFYTAILRDITERKRFQENLEYFAGHDALTGLLNRHSLENTLNRTIARAKRRAISSLLYMDLDNFKEVNDKVGHSVGDEVLITLSGLLKSELRTEDTVFRIGGDEFAVLFEGMDSREALTAAERLRLVVERHPFELNGRVFPLSLSIGLIEIEGTLTTGELLSQADAAMYRAKAQGKNRVVVHSSK